MQDRIQINGVWYVREDISKEEEKDIEVTYSMSCHYENDDYVWEATRLMKDDEISYYPDIDRNKFDEIDFNHLLINHTFDFKKKVIK